MAQKYEMQYQPVTYQDFSGGWNPKWSVSNATQLADNQSPMMVNIDYISRYAFTKRRGIIQVGNALAASGVPWSLYTFRKADGTEILMASIGTTMYYLNGSNVWTALPSCPTFTTSLKFGFETIDGVVYFGNGVDGFYSWDGTSAVVATGGNPKGNIFLGALTRLFVAGVASDPTTLYYSAGGNPLQFGSPGGTQGFPDNITSLLAFNLSTGDEVVQIVLSNGDLYHFLFDANGDPSLQHVRSNVGGLVHRANAQVENANVILDQFRQIRAIGYQAYYQDIRSEARSILIDVYMNTLNVTNASSAYFLKNYYVSAQEPGATANNITLLYDENYQSWRLYNGFGANQFTVYGTNQTALATKVLFASSSQPYIFQLEPTAYDDNGIPIYSRFDTKDMDFGVPIDDKNVRFVKIAGKISSGCLLYIYGYYDGETTVPAFTKIIDGNGAYVDVVTPPVYGSFMFGVSSFGGPGGTTTVIPVNPFQVVFSCPGGEPFSSLRLSFVNEQADVDFVITQIKPYTDILDGSRIEPARFI